MPHYIQAIYPLKLHIRTRKHIETIPVKVGFIVQGRGLNALYHQCQYTFTVHTVMCKIKTDPVSAQLLVLEPLSLFLTVYQFQRAWTNAFHSSSFHQTTRNEPVANQRKRDLMSLSLVWTHVLLNQLCCNFHKYSLLTSPNESARYVCMAHYMQYVNTCSITFCGFKNSGSTLYSCQN